MARELVLTRSDSPTAAATARLVPLKNVASDFANGLVTPALQAMADYIAAEIDFVVEALKRLDDPGQARRPQ